MAKIKICRHCVRWNAGVRKGCSLLHYKVNKNSPACIDFTNANPKPKKWEVEDGKVITNI